MNRREQRALVGVAGIIAIVAAVLLLRGATSPGSFTEHVTSPPTHPLDATSGWTVEQQGGEACIRIVIGTSATTCWGLHYKPGDDFVSRYEGLGHRFLIIGYASTTPVSGRWFSSNAAGTDLAFTDAGHDVYVAVISLGAVEPYGVHIIKPDGTLVQALSLTS